MCLAVQGTDISTSKAKGLSMYVATPKGELLKWDPKDPLNVNIIDDSLPSDSKAPGHNTNNANSPNLSKDEPFKTDLDVLMDNSKFDPRTDGLYE